jgi:hypothetical protein
MSLKIENSRRVDESRPVCMGLKLSVIIGQQYIAGTDVSQVITHRLDWLPVGIPGGGSSSTDSIGVTCLELRLMARLRDSPASSWDRYYIYGDWLWKWKLLDDSGRHYVFANYLLVDKITEFWLIILSTVLEYTSTINKSKWLFNTSVYSVNSWYKINSKRGLCKCM